MNSVKDVLEKYNYRIDKLTLNNNIRIIDSPSGKFVVKKRKNKDTRELFRYLNSKNKIRSKYVIKVFLQSIKIK